MLNDECGMLNLIHHSACPNASKCFTTLRPNPLKLYPPSSTLTPLPPQCLSADSTSSLVILKKQSSVTFICAKGSSICASKPAEISSISGPNESSLGKTCEPNAARYSSSPLPGIIGIF